MIRLRQPCALKHNFRFRSRLFNLNCPPMILRGYGINRNPLVFHQVFLYSLWPPSVRTLVLICAYVGICGRVRKRGKSSVLRHMNKRARLLALIWDARQNTAEEITRPLAFKN